MALRLVPVIKHANGRWPKTFSETCFIRRRLHRNLFDDVWIQTISNINCLAISSSISRASTIHWAQIESNEQIISSLMAAGQWQSSLGAQTKATYGWDETGETWWSWYRVTMVMWTWSVCDLWCLKLVWCAWMLVWVRDGSVVWLAWLDLVNFIMVMLKIHLCLFCRFRWEEGWDKHSKIHSVVPFCHHAV